MGLVKEAQREVENIFAVDDRPKALGALLGGRKKRGKYLRSGIEGAKFSPAFLPTSFENAFLYRSAHGLAASELKCLDKAYIDKIGREEVSCKIYSNAVPFYGFAIIYSITSFELTMTSKFSSAFCNSKERKIRVEDAFRREEVRCRSPNCQRSCSVQRAPRSIQLSQATWRPSILPWGQKDSRETHREAD